MGSHTLRRRGGELQKEATDDAVADGNRLAKAQLDRRLAKWKKRYPELDVRSVAVHGSTLNYLAKNADSIELHGSAWSVLIWEPQNVL
jgi:hypothetical protein